MSMWRDRQGDIWTEGDDGLMHTPDDTMSFPREHVERKWGPLEPVEVKTIRTSLVLDAADLRRHAERHAEWGNHGAAHVLFAAATSIEAAETAADIPAWLGTPTDPITRPHPHLEPVVAPQGPDGCVCWDATVCPRMVERCEPVVAPLPSEAAEWAQQLRDSIEKCCQCTDGHHDQIGYIFGTEQDVHVPRDIARRLAGLLDRLVPEDDEDTVRVPRQAVERLQELLALYRDDPYAPTSAIADLLATLDGTR